MARRKKRKSGFAAIPVREPFMLVERNPQLVAAICLAVLSIIAICAALYAGRAYLLPIATAFVFSVILAPVCGRLEWFRIPRAIAALLALGLASATAYAGFYLIAQPAAGWVQDAPEILRKAERQLVKLREPLEDLSKQVDGLGIVPADIPKTRTVIVEGPQLTESLISSAQAVAVQAGFVLILTYFFLLTREDFRQKIIAFQSRLGDRVRTARAVRDIEQRVAGYIVTFSIINLGLGVATGLACWKLGLPEPAMWGGIAALLNFIPFVGPAITMGLLGMAGLATFNTLLEAAFPVLAFWALNLVESNLVTPTIMGRRMTLNPLAIVLSVSFWTWIWGPVGGVISLPLLIMFKVICDHTPVLRVVGALIGAPIERGKPPETELDAKAPTAAIPETIPIAQPAEPASAIAAE